MSNDAIMSHKSALLLIFGIIAFGTVEGYITHYKKYNSKERIKECGYITQIEPERRADGMNVRFFYLQGQHSLIRFYYIINPGLKKIVNKKEKDNQKIYKTMQINDKVCITYSPKYYERSFYIGGEKVPYIFYIEWDRR